MINGSKVLNYTLILLLTLSFSKPTRTKLFLGASIHNSSDIYQ